MFAFVLRLRLLYSLPLVHQTMGRGGKATNQSTPRQNVPRSTVQAGATTSSLAEEILLKVREEVSLAVAEALRTFQAQLDDLKSENAILKERLADVERECELKVDDLEQYGRRTSLRVFGIKESEKENTDDIVIKLLEDKLAIKLPLEDIHRSHRVGRLEKKATTKNGNPNSTADRPRPIIVRFSSYRVRQRVFQAKRKLAGTGVVIREDLTRHRLALLNAAATMYGMKNTWTSDGRIKFAVGEGPTRRIRTAERIEHLHLQ